MDDDELDGPEPNCWTYTVLMQVHPTGQSTGGYLLDVTLYFSSPNVSLATLQRITQRNIGDYLIAFSDSPKFAERFGTTYTFTITDIIVLRGC